MHKNQFYFLAVIMQLGSTKLRMFLAFCSILLLVFALGLLSIERIKNFKVLSTDIRTRILQNTRIFSILDNDTSDYRITEASHILSAEPAEMLALEKEVGRLEKTILQAQNNYYEIRHSAAEVAIFGKFSARWDEYRSIVNRVLELSRTNHKAEASALYFNSSRLAFNETTRAIVDLINLNVSTAQEEHGRVDKTYRDALVLICIALLVTVLMIAGAFQYISHYVLTPMLNLAGHMHRLAGNKTDIEIKGTERRDEIGDMARSVVVFRNNSIDLELSQKKLTLQAVMLENMLEDERRLTTLQRNFVSMASHEFRTPLTIIDGHAQRMIKMKDRLGPDEIAQRAGKLRGAVRQMTSLIESLLNSSHLLDDNNKIVFHQDTIDLTTLLHEVCYSQQDISPEAHILEEFGPQPVTMTGDSKLLYLVFNNILSNAIKYSPNDTPITITASKGPETVVVCVHDQGIGIPTKDLDRLFDRYYRGSNVSSISGTGVGLYLVKIIVELHGGEIAVESSEGKGARIIVTLPLERLH